MSPDQTPQSVPPRRRRYARIECRVSVAVKETEGEGHLVFRSGNVSLGGIFIESDLLLEVGALVRVAFTLPDQEKACVADGAIVRVADEDSRGNVISGMGLEFTRIDPETRRRLELYLKAKLAGLEENSRGRR